MLRFLVSSEELGRIRVVLEDNGGAIALAENPVSSSNGKHIDERRHFLRELVNTKNDEVEHMKKRRAVR